MTMKRLLLLLLITTLLFSACQQQVAEVAYDLDSKSILLNQTRNSQKTVIFQSTSTPTHPSNISKIQTFKGTVLKIEDAGSGQGGRITLADSAAEELLINVDMSTQIKIALNMELTIRYTIEDEKINLIEIKKVE